MAECIVENKDGCIDRCASLEEAIESAKADAMEDTIGDDVFKIYKLAATVTAQAPLVEMEPTK